MYHGMIIYMLQSTESRSKRQGCFRLFAIQCQYACSMHDVPQWIYLIRNIHCCGSLKNYWFPIRQKLFVMALYIYNCICFFTLLYIIPKDSSDIFIILVLTESFKKHDKKTICIMANLRYSMFLWTIKR